MSLHATPHAHARHMHARPICMQVGQLLQTSTGMVCAVASSPQATCPNTFPHSHHSTSKTNAITLPWGSKHPKADQKPAQSPGNSGPAKLTPWWLHAPFMNIQQGPGGGFLEKEDKQVWAEPAKEVARDTRLLPTTNEREKEQLFALGVTGLSPASHQPPSHWGEKGTGRSHACGGDTNTGHTTSCVHAMITTTWTACVRADNMQNTKMCVAGRAAVTDAIACE